MATYNINSKRGFTIIEVVLVLAIAGLIFLMVFVALPALQRSQRDTQRRDDMGRFMAQLSQYQANNNGRTPAQTAANATTASAANWNSFIANYLRAGNDTFTDPDGSDYQVGYVCVMTNDTTCNPVNSTAGTPAVLPSNNNMVWDTMKNKIYVYVGARCNGESITFVSGSPRQIAIRYKLEGAGIYCGNN